MRELVWSGARVVKYEELGDSTLRLLSWTLPRPMCRVLVHILPVHRENLLGCHSTPTSSCSAPTEAARAGLATNEGLGLSRFALNRGAHSSRVGASQGRGWSPGLSGFLRKPLPSGAGRGSREANPRHTQNESPLTSTHTTVTTVLDASATGNSKTVSRLSFRPSCQG